MRFRELSEAPVEVNFHGDPHTDGSIHRDDRFFATNQRAIERRIKIWRNSVADVVIHLVNLDGDPNDALTSALDDDHLALDASGYKTIEVAGETFGARPGVISAVLTNNAGANRIPLTGWMIAHRLYHAIDISGKYADAVKPLRAARWHIDSFADFVDNNFTGGRGVSTLRSSIYYALGTTRAFREHNATGPGELHPEMFAQYMLTGSVKFGTVPRELTPSGFGHTFAARTVESDETYAEIIKETEVVRLKIEKCFAAAIEECKGLIFQL